MRPRCQPLERGPRQREAQGDRRELRHPHRARIAIGDRLGDLLGRWRGATGRGLGERERRLAGVGADLTAGSGHAPRMAQVTTHRGTTPAPFYSLARAAWMPYALTWDPASGALHSVEGPRGFDTYRAALEASRFLVPTSAREAREARIIRAVPSRPP
jgi:hypothetical protein